MHDHEAEQQLIIRGLSTVETILCLNERIALLDAAARLLADKDLSQRCSVTAACLREAEGAQLRLFKSLRN
jgi:hypothetical protein